MNKRVIISILVAVLIYAVSVRPSPTVDPVFLIPYFDKIAHFLLFGFLGTLLFRVPRWDDFTWKYLINIAIWVSIYGMIIEIHQGLTPSRTPEVYDWIADTLGAFTAGFLYKKSDLYRKILEFEVFGLKGEKTSYPED